MKTIYGYVMNQNTQTLSGVQVKAGDATTTTSADGWYQLDISDTYKGIVEVPEQTVGYINVSRGFAIINTENTLNYNIVVMTTVDSGKKTEERFQALEQKVSQLEAKFRMMVEIIIPMVLKK